jgi:photosystem II stability/assembly factor-like uncharacterized protein
MKRQIRILAVTFLFASLLSANNSFAQGWVLAGSVPNPGQRPSISVFLPDVAWIADGSVDTPKVFRTIDGGLNWVSLPTGAMNKEVYCIWALTTNSAVVGEGVVNGNARLFYTYDAGSNWTVVGQTGSNQGYFNGIVFSRSDTTYGFAIAERILKTTNGGANWFVINSGVSGVSNAHNSLFMIDNYFYGFGMNNGAARVRLTTDDGVTWDNQQIGVPGNYTSAIAFSTNKLYGLAATSSSMPLIARTVNGGQTWSVVNIDTGLTGAVKIKWVAGTSVVYIMGENGKIKRSNDNGLSWVMQQVPPGVTGLYHFDFVRRRESIVYGYAVSTDGTVIKLIDSIVYVPTGNQEIHSGVPEQYKLYQNYPNPFNPSTVISFDIPRTSFARLIIYDALGREQESLVNKELNAGYHEITWNASGYATGIYYYTFYGDGFTESKKMVLTK